jgi:dynein heavy chain, axonemal
MDRRLHLVSLGQGQGVKAEEVLSAAAETGNWVMLQNCHLAQSWLPQLQRFGKRF